MYKKIYVPLDNSQHSDSCIDFSMALAQATGANLVGNHVYAGKMHDMRFKQMEFTLPDKYRVETELEKQRRTHDTLIEKGLKLISNSYLDVMQERCKEAGLPFEQKTFDGRNYAEIVKDVNESDYDLVVMGAHGQGAVKGSLIGSVTERVVRRIAVDTLIVKEVQPWQEQTNGHSTGRPIIVALDGSPQSFHGLNIGMFLARQFNKPLQAVAVFDPYLHYSIFHSIAEVLSDEAAQVFKFKEQEEMHEEVIDTGLAKIYQSHLEVGKKLADAEGMVLETTLLPGKPFEKIHQHVIKKNAWLLICGRIGIHSEQDMDIGSNSENLMRMAPCHVLLTSGKCVPPVDIKAQESIHWTDEAIQRMEQVPDFVRGVARNAVLRWAMERGHSVITSGVIEQSMGDILPPGAAAAMGLAVKVAEKKLAEEAVFVCDNCGHTVRGQQPVKCVVCEAAGEAFTKLDKAAIQSKAQTEGALESETTFDGVQLAWTSEARQALDSVPSGYPRRRAKAQIEKEARVRKLPTITRELVMQAIEEGSGTSAETIESKLPESSAHQTSQSAATHGAKTVVWTEAAEARLLKVPEGFMREMTRERISAFAQRTSATTVTPELVEEKYKEWASGSEKRSMQMEWEPEALERINRIPDFIRGMVALEVERCAREMKIDKVTGAAVDKAKNVWERSGEFHSEVTPSQYENQPETTVTWTAEAEERLQRVPGFVREVARKSVEKYAAANGHTTITAEIMMAARKESGM